MKYYSSLFAIIFFLIFFKSCGTESTPSDEDIQWIKTYGGSEMEYAKSIFETDDDGYILVGRTKSSDGDFTELNIFGDMIFAMKLNSMGEIEWTKTFGGSGIDRGNSVLQTNDSGFIISGMTTSNDGDFENMNRGDRDRFLIKLENSGETEWIKTYGGSSTDWGEEHTLTQTFSGEYVLTGHSSSTDGDFDGINQSRSSIFVMQVSTSGDIQWINTFSGSGSQSGRGINSTSDGGLILTGYSTSNDGDFDDLNRGDRDIVLIKLNSSGETEWLRTFGGSGHDFGLSTTVGNDNSYLITGYTDSNDGDFEDINSGNYDIFVIKVDQNGDTEWIQSYGGSNEEFGHAIISLSDDSYLVTGYTKSNDGDFNEIKEDWSDDIFIMKLSESGTKEWIKIYGGSGNETAHSIIENSQGEYVLTGTTRSDDGDFSEMNKGESDIFVLKVKPDGSISIIN